MNARLLTLQRSFDARSPRERVLLIAAAAALVLLLADALWLQPAFQQWKAAREQARNTLAAHEAVVAEVARLGSRGQAQAQQFRQDIDAWRQRTRAGEEALRRYEETLVGPDQMLSLLEQLLGRHGQLRVLSMRTLSRVDLLATAGNNGAGHATLPATPGTGPNGTTNAPAANANAGAAAASTPGLANTKMAQAAELAAEPSLYRHGVELVLEGGYADLVAYLRAIESQPRRVLWGGLSLKAEHPNSVLTLRLYTISRDRHWLEI